MPTFKVVVIGQSGVGKTSIRGQFISGRFSSAYRATIGADFTTKTLPPIGDSTEPVVLQIWDTAGQERFSSLSTAFFRGADAAILVYDVNAPASLYGLQKWWDEFQEKAPVSKEDIEDGRFCAVVVGNKVDLLEGKDEDDIVSPAQGARFVRALIPRVDTPPPTPGPLKSLTVNGDEETTASDDEDPLASSQLTARPSSSPKPISILRHPHLTPGHRKINSSSQISFTNGLRQPRAHSTSRSRAASTITSTLSIYHTPSSSVFSDGASEFYSFHSAQSSSYSQSPDGDSPVLTNGNGHVNGSGRAHSPSARSASEITITPARLSESRSVSPSPNGRTGSVPPPINTTAASPFAPSNKTADERAMDFGPSSAALSPLPYQKHIPFGLDQGITRSMKGRGTVVLSNASAGSSVESLPREEPEAENNFLLEPEIDAGPGSSAGGHFRVSARTGDGVHDVFNWVARRLVAEWERDRREMDFGEAGDRDTIRARGKGRRHRSGNGNSNGGVEERLRLQNGNPSSANLGGLTNWGVPTARCC
ncbi:Rab small monomeric GTPase [Mycena chlorophos]|uniref:Rab small monomeric GTPase n=1 Tax=Mycena chlorophos TaxID=658473 RepID=A0A8H6TKY9_MYCCL|nr:Rab small monomeric GTPase [Mycena chlorophos]